MPDLSSEHQDIPMPKGYVDNGGAKVLRILDGHIARYTPASENAGECPDIKELGNIYDCDEEY